MKDSIKNTKTLAPKDAKVTKVDFVDASSAPSKNTKLVKKKGAQAGDPTKQAAPARTHVKATSGARYGVRVKFQKQESPEAGATQGNGRILPSAVNRQAPNFSAGMGDHN